jgi:ABC-type lipoprotein release transport system permease subunit
VGGAIGLVGAVGAGRLLQGALAGVTPWDPIVLAGVPLLVFGIVVAATLAPALRAARRDPGETLRAE